MKVFYEYWNYFFIFKISNKFEKWPETFLRGGGAELDEKGIHHDSRDYFTTIKTLNIWKLCFEFDYQNGLQITPNLRVEDPDTYLKLVEYWDKN